MKISASIYSNKEKPLETLVRELDAHNIDMFHIDCKGNDKVFDDIKLIRQWSKTPIDLHIISDKPEQYFDRIKELQIEYVSLQYEELKAVPALPLGTNTKFGLALSNDTSINDIFNSLPFGEGWGGAVSFIMMMCTVPGQSGGVFNKESFQKIIECRHLFPKMQVQVDGGVNDQVAYILRLLGVNSIVSGSYLMKHESLGAGMLSFHKAPSSEKETYTIADFATPLKYLPVLNKREITFHSVLQTIEDYGLGFVAIINDNQELEGVITNADVRRGLLANAHDYNEVNPMSLINTKPVTIQGDSSLSGMVRLLNSLNFIVLFLPVVDEQNRLQGAVLLNNLTRV